jgi:hypothetical protein
MPRWVEGLVHRVATVVLVAVAACADPLTNDRTTQPAWVVNNVQGYARTATGDPPDTAYASGLAVEGEVARWHECSAIDTCGETQRERPKQDVLAIETVGKASVGDGGTVDVLKLTLAPGRKYVVPYTNPGKSTGR